MSEVDVLGQEESKFSAELHRPITKGCVWPEKFIAYMYIITAGTISGMCVKTVQVDKLTYEEVQTKNYVNWPLELESVLATFTAGAEHTVDTRWDGILFCPPYDS